VKSYPNVTFDDYRKLEAWNASTLKKVLRSPAHALVEHPTSDAMRLGSLAHDALECSIRGVAFADRYVVKPDKLDLRTKDGRKWRADAAAAGCDVVSADMYDAACAIRNNALRASVNAQVAVEDLVRSDQCTVEETIVSTDEQTGLKVKARLDWRRPDLKIIGDWKTCRDARPRDFFRSIANFGYHTSAAHYLDISESATFLWIAIETDPPYAARCYHATDTSEIIERGRVEVAKALETIKRCIDAGDWPAYDEPSIEAELPKWA